MNKDKISGGNGVSATGRGSKSAVNALVSLSSDFKSLFLEWFNAVEDLNPDYLEVRDYVAARMLYESSGRRVPVSVLNGCFGEPKKPGDYDHDYFTGG